MVSKPVLVFDFDGTIADTWESFLKVVGQFMSDFGYKRMGKENVERFRNQGARELIKKLGISFTKLPLLAKKVRKELSKEAESFKLINGIKKPLFSLKESGHVLGILTSNSEENVKTFLTRNEINIFDFVYSGSSIFGKDKAIKRLLKEKKFSPEEIIYFGDEVRDIQSAKRAGVKVFAVTWGYNTMEILKQHQPNRLVSKPEELATCFG